MTKHQTRRNEVPRKSQKLSSQDKADIIQKWKEGEKQKVIAQLFHVSVPTISKVVRGARKKPQFEDRVEKGEGDCWLWTGALKAGYGQWRNKYAHRVSYEKFKGEIPENQQVCHTCDIPRCVNPEHLFLGTHAENMQDAHRKGRAFQLKSGGRLTDGQVQKIRVLAESTTQVELAEMFGTTQPNISSIINRKTWKHC